MSSKEIKDSKLGVAYYFSGTGNTSYVINSWAQLFKQNKIIIDNQKIEDILTVTSQKDYDFLIIAYPVYAWYPPNFVLDFLDQLPNVESKKVVLIATCSSQVGSSLSVARKILEKKNYDVIGTLVYSMPSNANYMFNKDVESKEKMNQKIKFTDEKIKLDFEQIYSGEKKIIKKNIFLRSIHSFIHWGFSKQLNKAQWVVDKNKCTLCGACQEMCPTKNITVKKMKREVKFSNNCVSCTRCYNFCPAKAIVYKKINPKAKDKGRYTLLKEFILNKD